MGKHAVDNAAFACKLPKHGCVTATLPIHGFQDNANIEDVLSIYGSDAKKINQLIIEQPYLQEKIHPALPYSKATVVWAVQNEMAMTVEDVLARRTRSLFLDAKAAVEAASLVASIMAPLLNQTEQWQQQQVKQFTALSHNYLLH